VRRRIGSGAFATVWLAYDEQLDSPVAIKVLADNWTEDHHVRQRFVEEGRFLRKVESPHVVSVYDAGELPDGRPFLVMSYADQGSLADRLELSTLTPAQALHVVRQVGDGLTALHDRGVLHRDVKPANVLFRTVDVPRRGGNGSSGGAGQQVSAMLGDLGLGKAMDMSSRLTVVGGTPSYVAPEQAAGDSPDARADQYALAALTYYLVVGRPPHEHRTLSAAAEPPPPPPMGDGVPDEVEAVVLKALSKDRDERYDDVADFVSALTGAMSEMVGSATGEAPQTWIPVDPELTQAAPRPEETRPPGPLPPPSVPPATEQGRRRRWPLVAAGLVAVLVGAGAGWAAERAVSTERTLDDSSGSLTVTVPERWTAVDPDQWTPPEAEVGYPSIAAGAATGWQDPDDPGEGVFLGVLPATELPRTVPQHPECETTRPPVRDSRDGDDYVTVVSTGCPGPDVTVERVVQLNATQLLWVQVRSADQRTANRVLDSVELHGL
jgi:hypothetical protein